VLKKLQENKKSLEQLVVMIKGESTAMKDAKEQVKKAKEEQ